MILAHRINYRICVKSIIQFEKIAKMKNDKKYTNICLT